MKTLNFQLRWFLIILMDFSYVYHSLLVKAFQYHHPYKSRNNSLVYGMNRHRKRYLIDFPDDSVAELNFKLTVPYYDANSLTITGDYRLDLTFQLPDELHQFHDHPHSKFDNDQQYVYDTMTHFIDRMGYSGENCLLKAICELAANPLHDYGVYGDIFSLVLSPSHSRHFHWNEHLQAEEHGLQHGRCDDMYPECGVSVRSVIVSAIMGSHGFDDYGYQQHAMEPYMNL